LVKAGALGDEYRLGAVGILFDDVAGLPELLHSHEARVEHGLLGFFDAELLRGLRSDLAVSRDQIVQLVIHPLAGPPQEGDADQQSRHQTDAKEEEDRDHGVAGWAEDGIDSQQSGEQAPDLENVLPEPHQDRDADQHGHDEDEAGNDESPQTRKEHAHEDASLLEEHHLPRTIDTRVATERGLDRLEFVYRTEPDERRRDALADSRGRCTV
jgi:hypothetical protein